MNERENGRSEIEMDPLFVLISFIIGFIITALIRYVGDVPFPWEFRRRNPNPSLLPDLPDAEGLAQSLGKLEDGYEFNAVMGNVNSKVCNTNRVLEALEKALEKDVKINIICGPSVDSKSKDFLKLLDSSKVKLFKLESWPERHFRVIKDSEGKCKWVYVEELHPPFKSYGYRRVKSSRLANEYQEIFEEFKKQTRVCTIKDSGMVGSP